jgi:uncharacterized protein DUF3891
MIRHPSGQDWLLFTQHDHALLAGRLAEQFGNSDFAKPSPHAIQGIALHDCGWPLHDDRPTLNPKGEPLHVFESPVWIGVQVWSASARRASNKDAWAGLLASIHGMHLATFVTQFQKTQRDLFELNKFQHDQVELQESLRRTLHMRTDIPVNHGLAQPGVNPQEDQLRFDYHLLRALDQVSLSLLCAEKMFDSVELDPRPGAKPLRLRLDRPAEFTVALDPYPFVASPLGFTIPCRRMPAATYSDVEAFRDDYANASFDQIEVTVSAASGQ